MNTPEKSVEEVIPAHLSETHTALETKPDYQWDSSSFRMGYGLGYFPDNFAELSVKEKLKASFATVIGNQYSIQDLKFFASATDDQLFEGVSREDATLMIQRRLEWQNDAIQLLAMDLPKDPASSNVEIVTGQI